MLRAFPPAPPSPPTPRLGYGVNVYSEIPCPIIGTVYYDDYLLPIQAKDAEMYYQQIGGHTIVYNGQDVPVTFLAMYLKNPLTTSFENNSFSTTIVQTGSNIYVKRVSP